MMKMILIFTKRFANFKTDLEKQIADEAELNERIKNNLLKIIFKK